MSRDLAGKVDRSRAWFARLLESRPGERRNYARLSGWRVPAGYLFGVLSLFLAVPPTRKSIAIGLPIALLGEVLRVWASGHIDKTESLATGGPYAYSRNPLYLGSLMICLGLAAALGSLVAVVVAVYFVVFYPSVMREESDFLRRRFQEEYAMWAKAVPMFMPRLTPGGPRGTRFSWRRVRRNLEWRTVAAVLGVAVLLISWSVLRRG
jgi:protein-S-isoprenylcysteine O-methyltransferase Ste14